MPPTPVPSPLLSLSGCACFCVFPGFLPSPASAFLGPQQTFLVVICLSAVSQDAVFFGFKIVGGSDFISAWKGRVVLTVALHFLSAVMGIILEWYGPKGCERIV
jgi:hypothetical protein